SRFKRRPVITVPSFATARYVRLEGAISASGSRRSRFNCAAMAAVVGGGGVSPKPTNRTAGGRGSPIVVKSGPVREPVSPIRWQLRQLPLPCRIVLPRAASPSGGASTAEIAAAFAEKDFR